VLGQRCGELETTEIELGVVVTAGISGVNASPQAAAAITATTTPIAKMDAVRQDITELSARGSWPE
jgi:hypothetical protein